MASDQSSSTAFYRAPQIDRIERCVADGFDQRLKGIRVAIRIGDDSPDFRQVGVDRLLDPAMTEVNDVAVATVGLGQDDRRHDDANRPDRCEQKGVRPRRSLGAAQRIGIRDQRTRVYRDELHGRFS